MKHKLFKRIAGVTLAMFVVLSLFTLSITTFDDPLSQQIRKTTGYNLNSYIENITTKSSQGTLSTFDKTVLHTGLLAGVATSQVQYPEASRLLYHYVYGDGSTLKLSSSYFKESSYLQNTISRLGEGEHGPITLKQSDDWRLSLVLNPYYLTVTEQEVRLYHPQIAFEPVKSTNKVMTIVPVGKLRLKVYDNLISALNPKPFYTYSEWTIDQ